MERRRAIRAAVLIALCAAAAVPCSFDETPAFFLRVRPDDPIDKYVDGRIGIIGREYARSHLVVAYRWLSGNPPSDEERAGFRDLLQWRLGETREADQHQAWDSLRAQIRGTQVPSTPYRFRRFASYSSFENCTNESFRKAMTVLRDRVARFGVNSPAVQSWLEAQETVFSNCNQGEAVPKPADPALPALIRYDRAYQIAAANFYAMKYDVARVQFLAIAANKSSPWWQTARLVAARTLLRRSSIYGAMLEEPERDLRAILADASMAPIHEPARQLLNYTAFHLHPEERLTELAGTLMRGAATADEAKRALDDYTFLLDDPERTAGDDLTMWIRAFQSGKDATAQWKATKKVHWLAAAIAVDAPSEVDELLAAAAKIGPDSPAYPMLAYHRMRLHRDRTVLDRVLALDETKLPTSSRNLLLAQRRGIARSPAEYFRDAQVTPVGIDVDQSAEPFEHPLLAPDAAAVMNEWMPLDLLADAAASKDIHETIRKPILVAAWTRAILLDREDVAARLAPLVFALRPAIEERFTTWRKSRGAERRFAAADLIAHHAGQQPNVEWYGGSSFDYEEEGGGWWCLHHPEKGLAPPPFLTGTDEVQKLRELGSGATWLLRTFLDLANAHPRDPRVAENLSIAIKGTRHSCGDTETDALAEKAFNLLHRRYGKTEWAKETPYWYRAGH
ncbi:MAG TPA: hypothetical protein VKB93_09805 [Thermoanaerobaculia bacterium]|nr:hypothetical protein [Thermoanaerobaculia bacterium]